MGQTYKYGEHPSQWDKVKSYRFGRYEYGVIQNKKYPWDAAIVLWDGCSSGSSVDWHNLEFVERGNAP
jgi:hypothetical protein